MKTNKGITLIALVVTILVLLILAGVAITTLMGDNGIISKTETSKKTTEEAGIQETLQTGIEALKIDYHSNPNTGTIGQYIENHVDDLKKAIGAENETLTVSANKITYKGLQFTVDAQTGVITDRATAGSTKSWTTATEDGKTIITDGEGHKIKIGDKIAYDPSVGATDTTYTSLATNTGYDNNQIFNVATLSKTSGENWRVFGFNETTKEIIIIPENFVGPLADSTNYTSGPSLTYYYLKGRTGCQNGISELENICDLFGQGKYAKGARCITAKDINDITGYTVPDEVEWTYRRDASGTLKYSYQGQAETNFSGYPSTFWYYDENSTGEKWKNFDSEKINSSIELTNTSYSYTISITDSIQKELILGKQKDGGYYFTGTNGTGAVFNYWLGSSYVSTSSDYAIFGLRFVNSGILDHYALADSSGDEYTPYCGVRPLVSLQSGVNLEYSSGEWKFVE